MTPPAPSLELASKQPICPHLKALPTEPLARPVQVNKTEHEIYEKQEMSQTRDECPQRIWSRTRHMLQTRKT